MADKGTATKTEGRRTGGKGAPTVGYGGVAAEMRKGALRGADESIDLEAVTPGNALHPNFTYHGGPVVTCALLYTTFWGPSWSDAQHQQRAGRLNQFMKDFLASKYMNILSQYGSGNGAGAAGLFVQPSFVANVPSQLSDAQIRSTIQSCINAGAIPEPGTPSNLVVVVILDETIEVSGAGGMPRMCEPSGDAAFGYHFFFNTAGGHHLYYAVIPSLDNACLQHSCSNDLTCSLHLGQTQEQRQTQVISHEYSELVTDPELTAWFEPGAENGDICNGESGTITVGANTWSVQRMYSKHDDMATNGAVTCITEAPNPIPKLSPGPAAGLEAATTLALQPAGALENLLPLPAIHVDAKKETATFDHRHLHRYARRIFAPLEHSHLFSDFPNFLRQAADTLEKPE